MRRQALNADETIGRNSVLSRGTRRAGFALLTAASWSFAPDAFAQLAGGGYDTGFAGSTNNLRGAVESLLPGGTRVSTGLAWTYGGDIEVDVGATDNAGGTINSGGRDWQFFTLISPDFYLNGDTPRLKVALSYSPRLAIYPQSSNQTFLANTFNGSATLTVVPDWLYVDVRAIGGISSRFGGEPLTTNAFISNNEAVQTASFSVSPYILHTFGGWGTLTAGYAYSRTFQSGDNTVTPFSNSLGFNTVNGPAFNTLNSTATAGFGTTGDLATNTEYATFTTGENLGRIQDTLSVTASQNSGSSFYQGSSTFAANNTLSYAVNRWLAVLGSVGYQEYRYPQGGYNLSEPSWAVGVTLTPNPDSTITVQYGRTAGSNTVLANASYTPTARTRVYGSYTVGIQTGLGSRQSLLGTTVVGPGGLLLDRTTGTPVLASSLLASQYTLSRVKTLTAGGVLLLDRDTFSASVTHDDVTQLIGSTDIFGISTNAGTNTTDTYATLAWQHDLNPTTNLYSSVSYGTSTTGVYFGNPGGSQNTLQLYTGLTHNFTETLSGTASFSHAERSGAAIRNLPTAFGGSTSQNVILVGLRKSF